MFILFYFPFLTEIQLSTTEMIQSNYKTIINYHSIRKPSTVSYSHKQTVT